MEIGRSTRNDSWNLHVGVGKKEKNLDCESWARERWSQNGSIIMAFADGPVYKFVMTRVPDIDL